MVTRKAIYRPFPQAVPNVYTIDRRGLSPCRVACPAGVNAHGYVALIAKGKFVEALEVLRRTMPFGGVCGRVCTHPCEQECERDKVDEPISIRALKRFMADYELKEGRGEVSLPETIYDKNIAVIGSGPAGLACAYDLALLGYPVTVYEAAPEAGGLLRYGIPEYRLPNAMLDNDIAYIEQMGVEIKTSSPVNSLKDTMAGGYKAVFLGIGAAKSQQMGIPGEDSAGVTAALDLLREVNSGEKVILGNRVAVIGGGNAAIDAARTAKRLGAGEVTIIYRRSRVEMPAIASEIAEAEEEGIKLDILAAPVAVLASKGRVSGLKCIRMELGEPDESGRRRPVPVEGSEYEVAVDNVIMAIGQTVDKTVLSDELAYTERDTIKVDPLTMETSLTGVFAGGDTVSGPSTVIEAIAAGKEAAISIDRYLRGKSRPRTVEQAAVTELPADAAARVIKINRQEMPRQPVSQRKGNFKLIEQGYDEFTAIREASRCLSCAAAARIVSTSRCATCLTCLRICPYGAPHLNSQGEVEIADVRCIACGLCATECPASVIELTRPGPDSLEADIQQVLSQPADEEGTVLGLLCHYGVPSTLEQLFDPRVRVVKIPCVSHLTVNHLLKAFEMGAVGVFIIVCADGECRYRDAIYWAELKVGQARKLLGEVGLDEDRLRLFRLTPYDSLGLYEWLTGLGERTGPSPATAGGGS
jgi:heterodisulfide reductase subunit A